MVRLELVAPGRLVPAWSHWKPNGSVPVATTVNIAAPPHSTVWPIGCVAMPSEGTVYWKTVASLESSAGVQLMQVPLLPKISGPPPECHALTMYLTTVPAGCAGMVALA